MKESGANIEKCVEIFWISVIKSSPGTDTSFLPFSIPSFLPSSLHSIHHRSRWSGNIDTPTGPEAQALSGIVLAGSQWVSRWPVQTRGRSVRVECEGWRLGRWCHQPLFSLLTTRPAGWGANSKIVPGLRFHRPTWLGPGGEERRRWRSSYGSVGTDLFTWGS